MWYVGLGAIIIAIGLVRGSSVFLGDFTVLSVLFDAVGAATVIRGLFSIKRSSSVKRPPPPPGASTQTP